ncbi:alpha/beta fold hydrolase [Maricaulis salignorans]|uniref:Pimeloyl-ACP methyl ester carboxylesterase n=1 Tax=Maricaulis salignorans TaxID=144026 RepID=A0A1G9QUK5_9PROT|nr:alpha/beta hydrolase [Maricaulis salignorans]SDM14571.1 Pimeloyl-ACP methyl ester carboxylesterase [Maricaulis salignorans]
MSQGYSDHFFTTVDGPRLHYRDYAPVGDPRGVPVLCLHGLTRNVRDFEELAPRLAMLGRRVIVVSQRGRGRSDPDPQAERYQPLTYAVDMVGLLDALKVERAVFIGTSMGGLMTMLIAAQQPERIAAAIINDIGPEIAEAGLSRIKANVSVREPVTSWDDAAARSRESNLAAFPKRSDDRAFWLDFAHKTWIEAAERRIEPDYHAPIVAQIDTSDVAPDLWPLWEPFKAFPTLLVRGGVSDLLTPETVAEMKRRKADLEYVEVPDIGHAPFMTEPEAWAAIEAFMKRVD